MKYYARLYSTMFYIIISYYTLPDLITLYSIIV